MSSPTKKDRFTTCQSCGVPWVEHQGIIGTCKRVKQLEAALAQLAECNVASKRVRNIANKALGKT